MNAAFPPNSIDAFFTVFAHFSNINWNKESEEKFNYRVKLNETKFYILHQFLDRLGAATKNTTIYQWALRQKSNLCISIFTHTV
jgi:hypothetical protein